MQRWGRRQLGFLATAVAALTFLSAAATAAASNNVTYQGGPVSHSMAGVVVDWGAGVNPMYTDETTGDPGLIKYLASQSGSTGDIGGVIAQYMDSSGHNAANRESYAQQYEITPSVTSTTVYDSQIASELTSQITAGHLPHPAGDGLGTIYLVLFPSGDVECYDSNDCSANAPNPSTAVFCAYHSSTQLADGTNVLYAVLPDNTTGPMSTECGVAPTLLGDQTSFLSHEWAETITDPLGNAWWVNNASSPDNGNEIGDSCNQITADEGGWTVQQQWSNLDGNCEPGEPSYLAPTASFLAPDVAPPNQPVSFDASSSADPAQDNAAISGTGYSISSGISSYLWNWGDGSSSTTGSPTATHSYAGLGNYQVSLSVTDNLGFTSTVTRQVSIATSGTPGPSVATGASIDVFATAATVQGAINPENQSTQYQFIYGTSPVALTSSTPLTAGPSGQSATSVSATLSGLSPSTTYYYELEATAGGQTYSGSVQSFTTAATAPPQQTPIAATGAAGSVGTSSATLTGTIDPGGSQPVSYHFAYGTSPSNLSATTFQSSALSGTSSVPVSSILSGLSPNTTYYFRLDAQLGAGTYSGSVQSFTTRPAAPGASTGGASAITSTGALVSGLVSPGGVATSYLVEFGTTTAYGHSTALSSAGAGTRTVPVSITLSGLRARTRYHYRLVAISAGGTGVGSDATFMTSAALKPPPRFRFAVSVRRALRVRFHCSRACSAHFIVTVASAGLTRVTPVTVTLARVTGSIRARGSRTVSIRLSAAIRQRLRHGVKLVVLGYASSRASARSAPVAKPVP